MVEWIKQYAVPLIGGLVGLVFAILFLSIGFFKTLLVVLLTGLGIWLVFGTDRHCQKLFSS